MKEGRYMFRASEHETAISGAAELYLTKKENKALTNFVYNIRNKYAQINVGIIARFSPKDQKIVAVRIYLIIT